MLRTRTLITFAASLLLAAASPALANSSGSLRTSNGGTGLSTGHGSGGIKNQTSSTRFAAPAPGKLTPAKPHATPPAGVRPHTDLAAAAKLIALSSANLTKRSQLFPKQPSAPGDPTLSGPVLNKIGASEGGAGSFKALYSIRADLGGGRIYPNHSNGATGRSAATLSGHADLQIDEALAAAAEARGRSSGKGLLYWLQAVLTAAGMGAIGWWMWTASPKGATLVSASQPA